MGFLDWLTTILGVLGFGAVEVNPLFAGITKTNILVFSGIKLASAVLIGFLFYKAGNVGKTKGNIWPLGQRFVESGYFASLMVLTAVVTNNVIAVVKVI